VDQSVRDLDDLIQSLLNEASLGQWVDNLDVCTAEELLVRMNDCVGRAGESSFRLGQMQLQWAAWLLEKRLSRENPRQ